MADDLEKQVNQNTSDIRILIKASDDTLTGVTNLCVELKEDRKQHASDSLKDRERQAKSFDNIDKLLRGKDSENPGLVVKVDRLENSSNRLDKKIKNVMAASVTALTAMGATVLSWVLGLFGKGN